jgi:hypothetical protein
MGLPMETGCLTGISERFIENFRGVPVSTAFRVIDVI